MELLSLIWDIVKTLLSPFTKALKWFYEQLPFKIVIRKPSPKLGIIESSWRGHTWEYAKHRDKEIIAIHTHWQVTNALPYNITALNVFLTKPTQVKGYTLIKHHESDIWGSYTIPRGYTTEVEASFIIDKKFAKNSDTIIKAGIEFQDPLGRTHKLNQVIINPFLKNINVKKESLKTDDPSKLTNKIEKEVVAVLKNEIQQYKVRGRREGRLGTVEWPKGTIEWRDVDAKIKFLFENSNKDNVKSEHIDALLSLYNSSSPKDKRRVITALLNRIDKKSEYRDVGYLIIFFLFEVGHLKEGLQTALKELKGNKANAFGDVLRVLDFLLAFRYEEFDAPELNAIEAFVYSTKEHPFQMKERVNAIRVKQMLSSKEKLHEG